MASLERSSSTGSVSAGRVIGAVVVPIAAIALVFLLWSISDRLLYVGPVDRAAFGWIVVVPLFALTPLSAVVVWRGLNGFERTIAAIVVGVTIGGGATTLFWLSVASQGCEFGAVRTPAEWLVPSVVVGLVVGGGFAVTALGATSALRRFGWWPSTAAGAGAAMALIVVAMAVAATFIMSGGCLRP